ncbi:hypothetical protein [Helicobacter suis]|nr:hypothetical protein [Helicobacter suis]BDR28447.1 hypothetical protein HSHS1_12080 [Helicobacter suis HS1]
MWLEKPMQKPLLDSSVLEADSIYRVLREQKVKQTPTNEAIEALKAENKRLFQKLDFDIKALTSFMSVKHLEALDLDTKDLTASALRDNKDLASSAVSFDISSYSETSVLVRKSFFDLKTQEPLEKSNSKQLLADANASAIEKRSFSDVLSNAYNRPDSSLKRNVALSGDKGNNVSIENPLMSSTKTSEIFLKNQKDTFLLLDMLEKITECVKDLRAQPPHV